MRLTIRAGVFGYDAAVCPKLVAGAGIEPAASRYERDELTVTLPGNENLAWTAATHTAVHIMQHVSAGCTDSALTRRAWLSYSSRFTHLTSN